MAANMRLQVLLEAVDRLTGPLRGVQQRIEALARPIRNVDAATASIGRGAGMQRLAAHIGNVARRAREAASAIGALAGRVGMAAGVGGAIGGAAFARSALGNAAAMERYRLTLTQVEGSAEAARRALGWVSDFARRTPNGLDEVTRGFVDLRNLGLDPTRGALAAAGDAAAIMGTRFDEAVTALSAALRGEMDPLERFGVFGRVEGDNIVLQWEHLGQRMRAVVNKNDRDMRQQLARYIQLAWSQKFGGGMDQLSQSWTGMLSNLSDAWSRFQITVMDSGIFDWLKTRLGDLLAYVERLEQDGTLRRWANDISSELVRVGTIIEEFLLGPRRLLETGDGAASNNPIFTYEGGGALDKIAAALRVVRETFAGVQRILKPVLGDFGTFETIISLVALRLTGPLIANLVQLGIALAGLAWAVMTSPIGWAILALGTIAGLALLIYENWDGIVEFFAGIGRGIADALNAAYEAAKKLLGLLGQLEGTGQGRLSDPAEQQRRSRLWGGRGRNGGYYGEPMGALTEPGLGGRDARVTGTIEVHVTDDRVRVRSRSGTPGVAIDVDQGLLVGAP